MQSKAYLPLCALQALKHVLLFIQGVLLLDYLSEILLSSIYCFVVEASLRVDKAT